MSTTQFGQIEVRRFGMTDLPAMRQFESTLPVVESAAGPIASSPAFWRSIVKAGLGRGNRQLLVARHADRLVGYAQYFVHPSDQRWRLDTLVAETGVYDPEPVWSALIEGGLREAGMSGSKRLYASAARDSAIWNVLSEQQYSPYTCESVLISRHPDVRAAVTPLRKQQRSDTWSIHQLYINSVPREVQQAEALTSHEWDIVKHSWRADYRQGWLLENEHQVVAYCRVAQGDHGNWLELLVLPGESDAAISLFDAVVSELSRRSRSAAIFCIVRGYQQELIAPIESRDFRHAFEHDLMVRYTTVQQRAAIAERVHALEIIGKRVPRRAATVPKEA